MNVLDIYTPNAGYHATDKTSVPPNALADGSYNVLIQGNNNQRVFKGLKESGIGGRSMFKTINGFASLNDTSEVHGIGSIFNFISKSLFWIGEGKVYLNGSPVTDIVTDEEFVATSNLQLSPSPYEQAFTAGMAQPDAPIVEARTPEIVDSSVGLMTGLYSFKIARVRSLTGGRSIASPTSAAIPFSGQAARLTFPLADSNGQDRWAVFATKAGFGGTGLHYLVQEVAESDLVTIDGVERSYEFDIVDADLLPVRAYIDDYPPPAGSFAARLENYVVVIGAYDNAIAASIRNFPESFNPDDLAFLPSAPTAVLPDQMGSYVYISCESSVHALSVAPSSFGNPLVMQTVWTDTGVAHNHNWCSVEGAIFAFTSRQGAITMDSYGRPNNQFALPVAKKMQGWNPEDTCVFNVPDLNSVIYCNGSEAYAFNHQNMQWSSPAKLSDFASGSAISGVVIDRRLKICLINDDDFTLYDFDEPIEDGSTAFKIVSPDKVLNPGARINITGVRGIFNAPNTGDYDIDLATDFGTTEKTLTHTADAAGVQETKMSRWFVPRKTAYRVEWSGTQSEFDDSAYLGEITLYGEIEPSNVI